MLPMYIGVFLGIISCVAMFGWYFQTRRACDHVKSHKEALAEKALCIMRHAEEIREIQEAHAKELKETRDRYRIHRSSKTTNKSVNENDVHVWQRHHSSTGDVFTATTERRYQDSILYAKNNMRDCPWKEEDR